MKRYRSLVALLLAVAIGVPQGVVYSSSHREAPITALDHKADITDIYAFVSYGANQAPNTSPRKVTMILGIDPLLEPANGPTLFPFDPDILYEIHVDNDHDALADVTFQFRFFTEYQLPNIYTSVVGIGDRGANAPGTSTLVVPPQIRDFNNPGLNLRQHYTVAVVRHRKEENDERRADTRNRGREDEEDEAIQITNHDGSPFFAVPANAGPRTMDYPALFKAGTYSNLNVPGVSVFAGTTDDAFWIDLGATFDTANFRTLGSGIPGVLTAEEDEPICTKAKNFQRYGLRLRRELDRDRSSDRVADAHREDRVRQFARRRHRRLVHHLAPAGDRAPLALPGSEQGQVEASAAYGQLADQ